MQADPASAAKLAVVILAAGRSRRMGKPKLLLPWGATSILGHQVNTWQRLGAVQIGVVFAKNDTGMTGELERLGFPVENRIPNSRPEDGMFSSIRCAAGWGGWMPELTHWALTLGDQPHVGFETLKAVIELSKTQPTTVCQPQRLGHFRHPVTLPKAIFQKLGETKVATLKDFLSGQEIAACDVDDPGLELDIDEPQDYERALQLASMLH